MLGKIIEHRLEISGDGTIRAVLLLFDEDIPARAEGGSGVPEAIICGGFQGSFALAPTPGGMLQGCAPWSSGVAPYDWECKHSFVMSEGKQGH